MRARLRSALFGAGLAVGLVCGVASCVDRGLDSQEPGHRRTDPRDEGRKVEGDPRVDPTRCTGDGLELASLVGAGLCSIGVAEANSLPGPELLEIVAPSKLVVESGARLEFDLVLRNRSATPVDVDLRLRRFLPLGPETTQALADGSRPDPSCTMRAMSTEPPPERITLPPEAELAIPCEWHANTRLVDPSSYVGSECPDFPALAPGRYRAVFRINGGAGSQREVGVDIEVRAAP